MEVLWHQLACKIRYLLQEDTHSWHFLVECSWNMGRYFGHSWPECCFINSEFCVRISYSSSSWFSLYVWEWHHWYILHAWSKAKGCVSTIYKTDWNHPVTTGKYNFCVINMAVMLGQRINRARKQCEADRNQSSETLIDFNRLYIVISQKLGLFMTTVLRTSDSK